MASLAEEEAEANRTPTCREVPALWRGDQQRIELELRIVT
jgi:hypothetical protein